MMLADEPGVSVEPFLYLSGRVARLAARAPALGMDAMRASCLAFTPGAPAELDRWRDGDHDRAAALLQAAYTGDAAACFAPHGEFDEWLRYVSVLVEETQCGRFDPAVSRVVRDGGGLRALALVTALTPSAIHVAQLAVHPDWRRQGIASWLLAETAAAAAATGHEEITLLVRESNKGARRLYASLGFAPHGMGLHYDTAGQSFIST